MLSVQEKNAVQGVAPSNATPVLEARALTKHFRVAGRALRLQRSKIVQAVKGVDFVLHKQQTLSIVGESGCGKTTLAKLLLHLDQPTDGAVLFQGTPLAELRRNGDYARYRLGVQAVFQDSTSALSPRRRIRKIIGEPLVVAGVKGRAALDEQVRSLMRKVGLHDSVGESFPHELSGGMRQRAAIAQALATNPSVIILDEPVSALDVSIRAQILNLLRDVQESYGVSYVLIAHDLATVRYLSHSVIAMYLGSIMEQASAQAFFTQATHPYTLALLSAAMPNTGTAKQERIVLTGDLPSPTNPPPGCPFNARCWLSKSLDSPSLCRTEAPKPQSIGNGHRVACHFPDESMKSDGRRQILRQMVTIGAGRAPRGGML